jgi:tRNA pseudouridine38-40 synthase
LRLTLAYDGTNYVGWQRQATGVSVQGAVEDAFVPLFKGTGLAPTLIGASRTDAGVHALGQVASIRVPFEFPPEAVHRALNVRLPRDIRVLDVADADPAFHARYDARGKSYRYRIATTRILSPFDRAFVWHMPRPCNAALMRAAAPGLVGRHDFASFEGRDSPLLDTIRTLTRVEVIDAPGEIAVEVDGDGFLRHMVRIVVGTLVDVGCGIRPPAWAVQALASRDRRAAGQTAPASGLTLVAVLY